MEEKDLNKIIEATQWPRIMAACALGMLALFLLVAVFSELKSYQYIGTGIQASDTIQVSGEGTEYAVPDTAEFDVTVQANAADVATAQASATKQGNAIISYLEGQGVTDADIQTTDYEINPQYSYSQAACPQSSDGTIVSYCPPGKQTLTGYQVSQTLSVKVEDTSKAGTLLSGVGKLGASSVSGLSFTVSNEDAIQAQARDEAITQAEGKAQDLAKSLGVKLVRIVSFSDNQNGVVYPVGYAMNASAGGTASVPAPQIPAGQNKIVDDVTITYEIE